MNRCTYIQVHLHQRDTMHMLILTTHLRYLEIKRCITLSKTYIHVRKYNDQIWHIHLHVIRQTGAYHSSFTLAYMVMRMVVTLR